MTIADFTYPETKEYRALHAASKTRKLPDGRFEAVAAFWFMGVRQNLKTAIAETRHKAERAAMRAIGCA